MGRYNDVIAYPDNYASYTVSAWFMLNEAEASVPDFAVSFPHAGSFAKNVHRTFS
jgi:hypothetical protein